MHFIASLSPVFPQRHQWPFIKVTCKDSKHQIQQHNGTNFLWQHCSRISHQSTHCVGVTLFIGSSYVVTPEYNVSHRSGLNSGVEAICSFEGAKQENHKHNNAQNEIPIQFMWASVMPTSVKSPTNQQGD